MICWCWVWASQDHPCSEIRWTDSRTQPLVTLTVRTSHRGEGRTHGQPVRERTQAESGATSAPMRATRSTPPPLTRANVRPRSERKTGPAWTRVSRQSRHSEPPALRRADTSPADCFLAEFPDALGQPCRQVPGRTAVCPVHSSAWAGFSFWERDSFLFQQRSDFISLSKLLCTHCGISSGVCQFVLSQSVSPSHPCSCVLCPWTWPSSPSAEWGELLQHLLEPGPLGPYYLLDWFNALLHPD